jgi:hypothetical protein
MVYVRLDETQPVRGGDGFNLLFLHGAFIAYFSGSIALYLLSEYTIEHDIGACARSTLPPLQARLDLLKLGFLLFMTVAHWLCTLYTFVLILVDVRAYLVVACKRHRMSTTAPAPVPAPPTDAAIGQLLNVPVAVSAPLPHSIVSSISSTPTASTASTPFSSFASYAPQTHPQAIAPHPAAWVSVDYSIHAELDLTPHSDRQDSDLLHEFSERVHTDVARVVGPLLRLDLTQQL